MRTAYVAAAQKADLAALEQIGHRSGGFSGIAAATGDREDQIAEGKLGPMDFAQMFFHMGLAPFGDALSSKQFICHHRLVIGVIRGIRRLFYKTFMKIAILLTKKRSLSDICVSRLTLWPWGCSRDARLDQKDRKRCL